MKEFKRPTPRKDMKETPRNLYIILGIVGLFLVSFTGINVYFLVKKIKQDECFINLALFGEAMLAIEKESGLKLEPLKLSNEENMYLIFGWCEYGDNIFKDIAKKDYSLVSEEELQSRTKNKKPRFFIKFPKCPKGGGYVFIPSKFRPGMLDIKCTRHGTLYLPAPKDNLYRYDGDHAIFEGSQSEVGWKSKYKFPVENNTVNRDITILKYNPASDDSATTKTAAAK